MKNNQFTSCPDLFSLCAYMTCLIAVEQGQADHKIIPIHQEEKWELRAILKSCWTDLGMRNIP